MSVSIIDVIKILIDDQRQLIAGDALDGRAVTPSPHEIRFFSGVGAE